MEWEDTEEYLEELTKNLNVNTVGKWQMSGICHTIESEKARVRNELFYNSPMGTDMGYECR